MDFNAIYERTVKIAGEDYDMDAPEDNKKPSAVDKSIQRNAQKKAEQEKKQNAVLDKNRPLPLSAYDKLFKLKVFNSAKGDAFVDAYNPTNLATIVKELEGDKVLVAYYNTDVTKLPQKIQNALRQRIENKIENSQANAEAPEGEAKKPEGEEPINKEGGEVISNIQNVMNKLSSRSLQDLLYLAQDLLKRDAKRR